MKKSDKSYRISSILLLWLIGGAMSIGLSDGIHYDAADYWKRGSSIWQDGYFCLLNMNGFRGYIFPLFCGICNKIGGGV